MKKGLEQEKKRNHSFGGGGELAELDVLASIANQETIKKSVRQGMGISVLSRLATKDEAAAGLSKCFQLQTVGRDINLVYNKNYQLSRSAERFIKVVKEVYQVGKQAQSNL